MKLILLLTTILFSNVAESQIDHIEILLGKSESYVTNYLDSLNKLRPNSYSKVKTDISGGGELILSAQYAIVDGDFYKCTSIMARFTRIEETEICVTQIITGFTEHAHSNLAFIKDNFTPISNGKWEKPYNDTFRIMAEFERKDSQYPTYSIVYEFKLK